MTKGGYRKGGPVSPPGMPAMDDMQEAFLMATRWALSSDCECDTCVNLRAAFGIAPEEEAEGEGEECETCGVSSMMNIPQSLTSGMSSIQETSMMSAINFAESKACDCKACKLIRLGFEPEEDDVDRLINKLERKKKKEKKVKEE